MSCAFRSLIPGSAQAVRFVAEVAPKSRDWGVGTPLTSATVFYTSSLPHLSSVRRGFPACAPLFPRAPGLCTIHKASQPVGRNCPNFPSAEASAHFFGGIGRIYWWRSNRPDRPPMGISDDPPREQTLVAFWVNRSREPIPCYPSLYQTVFACQYHVKDEDIPDTWYFS